MILNELTINREFWNLLNKYFASISGGAKFIFPHPAVFSIKTLKTLLILLNIVEPVVLIKNSGLRNKCLTIKIDMAFVENIFLHNQLTFLTVKVVLLEPYKKMYPSIKSIFRGICTLWTIYLFTHQSMDQGIQGNGNVSFIIVVLKFSLRENFLKQL